MTNEIENLLEFDLAMKRITSDQWSRYMKSDKSLTITQMDNGFLLFYAERDENYDYVRKINKVFNSYEDLLIELENNPFESEEADTKE